MNRSFRLTPCELKVLKMISEGMTNKEAGVELKVSKRTIDYHLQNIYEKMEVTNRVLAIRIAQRLGLI